jgi:hypothetical protein
VSRNPSLTPCLQQLASEIDAAGLSLSEFLQLWTQKYGTTLRAADYGEFSIEDLIRRYVLRTILPPDLLSIAADWHFQVGSISVSVIQ